MRRHALVALVMLTMVGSCASESDLTLTESDHLSEVNVETGDTFEVRLESNPSTGYAWEVADTATEAFLDLLSRGYEEPTQENLVGAPGTEVFEFEAVETGAGILRLEYIRSFEDLPVAAKVIEYTVIVDDAPWPPDPGDTPTPSTSTETAP
jgi:inhibitor of cysteine peptidase